MKQTVSSCRTVNRKRKLDRGDSTAVGDETQKPKKMTRSDLVISVNESLTSVDNSTPTNGTEKRSRKVRSDSGKTFTSDNAELHQGKEANGKQSKLAKNRKAYVIFVGNLPYHASKEDIEKHFIRTGGVKEVRLLTDKITGKSRGCAYVEFLDSKSHRFGLRLHESMLGDRKINVEFTSRGRNTPKRKERLKEKNRRMARMKRVFDGPIKNLN